MLKLMGKNIYLGALEKEDCRKLYEDFEYDYETMAEPLNIGFSVSNSDLWFDEIQKCQGKEHVRIGVFLLDGTIIGDIALQDIDWRNRVCSIGLGFSKLEYRCKGYGSEAIKLILNYGFKHIGVERVTADTLEQNKSAQKCLEKNGFKLEGIERKAVYFLGKRWDRLNYSILIEEFNEK